MKRCMLCQRKDETPVTGAMLTKDVVTAHQNCLLYSSGICCEESPEFDELYGFSVDDVQKESKRGAKLDCKKCKKRGATVGCEISRCKKSFHFPCAMEAGAIKLEDSVNGQYGILCFNHSQPQREKSLSRQNSGNQSKPGPSKRRLSSDYMEKESPSKRINGEWSRIKPHDSSSSDDTDINMFAPIESDLDESLNSPLEPKRKGSVPQSPAQSPLVNHSEVAIEDTNHEEEDAVLCSDAESESLLRFSLPVNICIESQLLTESGGHLLTQTVPTFVKAEASSSESSPNDCRPEEKPCQPSTEPATSSSQSNPGSVRSSPPPKTNHVAAFSSSWPPYVDKRPNIDSSSFWKNCNLAGCTQAIFTDFFAEIQNVAGRIQDDQAHQEDYDLALSVLAASGKLVEFVAKQQEALQRKLTELQSAAAAMKDVVTALEEQKQ